MIERRRATVGPSGGFVCAPMILHHFAAGRAPEVGALVADCGRTSFVPLS